MIPRDTTAEIHRIQMATLRRLSGAQRSRLAKQFSRQVSATALAGRRSRQSDHVIDEQRVRTNPSMSDDTFFHRLTSALAVASIPYMTSGSVASSYHGEPRATFDVDIVIDPTADQLEAFLQPGGDWYVSAEAARAALSARSMFNVIDNLSGQKGDLILRKDRPFSICEFSRRQPAEVLGVPSMIASAEDVILSKLEWASLAESERQLRDAQRILEIQTSLDFEYLRHWAAQLGVTKRLEEVIAAAGV